MNKTITMRDVMKLLSEHKEAESRALMKEYIIQESRKINQRFMAEDIETELAIGDELEAQLGDVDVELDQLSDEIETDTIMDDGEAELADLADADPVEQIEDRVDAVEAETQDLRSSVDELRAEFEALMADEEIEDEEVEGEEAEELEGEEAEELEGDDVEEVEDDIEADLDAVDAEEGK